MQYAFDHASSPETSGRSMGISLSRGSVQNEMVTATTTSTRVDIADTFAAATSSRESCAACCQTQKHRCVHLASRQGDRCVHFASMRTDPMHRPHAHADVLPGCPRKSSRRPHRTTTPDPALPGGADRGYSRSGRPPRPRRPARGAFCDAATRSTRVA